MSNDVLYLICPCGTIYPACKMPIAIDAAIEAINAVSCPSCKKSSQRAGVYVEKRNEQGDQHAPQRSGMDARADNEDTKDLSQRRDGVGGS